MNFIKQFLDNRRARLKEKYQRMNSEILCAIVNQVEKEQKEQELKISAPYLVARRYNCLHIKKPIDLKNVYKSFFKQGLVSGIELQ